MFAKYYCVDNFHLLIKLTGDKIKKKLQFTYRTAIATWLVHLLSQLTRAKGMTELLSLLDLLSDAILLVLFSSKIVFNELALHSKMAT
jgi:hypothetical protein